MPHFKQPGVPRLNYQQIQQTAQLMQGGIQIVGQINELQQVMQAGEAQNQKFEQTQLQFSEQSRSMDQNYMQELNAEKTGRGSFHEGTKRRNPGAKTR